VRIAAAVENQTMPFIRTRRTAVRQNCGFFLKQQAFVFSSFLFYTFAARK